MAEPREIDPMGLEVEVRRVQAYVCPGCNQDIRVGEGHLVAVPLDAPDLRRHWHRGCWASRATRRPGRMR